MFETTARIARTTAPIAAATWVMLTAMLCAQQPQPTAAANASPAVTFDLDLLAHVQRIRVAAGRPTLQPGTDGYERDPIAIADIVDPGPVRQWTTALRQSFDPARRVTVGGTHCYLELQLGDGRVMRGTGDGPILHFENVWGAAVAELQDLLTVALAQAQRARGDVTDLAELRGLPAGVTRVQVPWLTALQVREELHRFALLTELELLPRADAAADASAALAIAELRTLQSLTLPAAAIDGEALRALARLPGLRSLTLTGDLGALSADGLAVLGTLETLRLPDAVASAEQLRSIGKLSRLRELWVQVTAPFDGAASCILALPRLQRLALAGSGGDATAMLAAVARTHIDKLALTTLPVSDDSMKPLADLPTLRELDLRGADIGKLHRETLVGIGQLRQLYITAPATPGRAPYPALVEQSTMGACRVVQTCTSVAAGPFAPLPSWAGG